MRSDQLSYLAIVLIAVQRYVKILFLQNFSKKNTLQTAFFTHPTDFSSLEISYPDILSNSHHSHNQTNTAKAHINSPQKHNFTDCPLICHSPRLLTWHKQQNAPQEPPFYQIWQHISIREGILSPHAQQSKKTPRNPSRLRGV